MSVTLRYNRFGSPSIGFTMEGVTPGWRLSAERAPEST